VKGLQRERLKQHNNMDRKRRRNKSNVGDLKEKKKRKKSE
jgi:hypothetical protein